MQKSVYVCGPLTELPFWLRWIAKRFYVQVAEVALKVLGVRGFVPHEHFDPIKHAHFSPGDVDAAERYLVRKKTSCLIVIASFGPSWGGGIEVEMARESGVPVIILYKERHWLFWWRTRRVSRLLRGNPAIVEIINYKTTKHGLYWLQRVLMYLVKTGRIKSYKQSPAAPQKVTNIRQGTS